MTVTLKDGVGANLQFGSYPDANGNLSLGHTPLVGGKPVAPDNAMPVSAPSLGAPADAEAPGDGSIIGLLKRLRTLLGGVLTVKQQVGGADVAAGNPVPAKLTDGTTPVVVTAQGSLSVSGQTAVGTAPATPPIAVSGVDGGGLKRHMLTDTSGVTQVRPAARMPTFAGANKPTLASLGTSLATLAADTYGGDVYVQNQSANALYLVFDDGTVTPPTSYEVDILTGVGSGQQGDSRLVEGFPGRVQVYGATSSQFMAWRR